MKQPEAAEDLSTLVHRVLARIRTGAEPPLEHRLGKSLKRLVAPTAPFPVASLRDQGINKNTIAAAYAAVSTFGNVAPLLHETLHADPERFDLQRLLGLDPAPLLNRHEPATVLPWVAATQHVVTRELGIAPPAGQAMLPWATVHSWLLEIIAGGLLGRNFDAKTAFVSDILHVRLRDMPDLDERPASPAASLVFFRLVHALLAARDSDPRLAGSVSSVKRVATRLMRGRFAYGEFLAAVAALHRRSSPHKDAALSDELLAETQAMISALDFLPDLGSRLSTRASLASTARTQSSLEWAFTPRDRRFLMSGDYYGECTASTVRSQVNPDIANIHWTAYAWLLDPFYRIIDVSYQGRRLIKAHILPTAIADQVVLLVDAIESIPQFREGRIEEEHASFDRSLFEAREEILEYLISVCLEIADMLGVETVMADKFSNAPWVRAALEQFPSDSHHVREVRTAFEDEAIRVTAESIAGEPVGAIAFEVQARNTHLIEQYAAQGYKEMAVLRGRRRNWRLHLRGP